MAAEVEVEEEDMKTCLEMIYLKKKKIKYCIVFIIFILISVQMFNPS